MNKEEQYIHLESCIDSLEKARWTLLEVKKHPNHPLLGPAFQFAIIEYAKPYKTSFGAELNDKGRPVHTYTIEKTLRDTCVPSEYLDLHKRLLTARDRILAHTDLGILDAKVHIATAPSGSYVSTIQNVVYGTEECSHIDEIIDLIERTLDRIDPESKRMRADLLRTQ